MYGYCGLVVGIFMRAGRDIVSFFFSYCDCFVVASCLMLDSLAKETALSMNTIISNI